MTPAKEDRREPQKWVSGEVRRPPGTLAACERERLPTNGLTRSSGRGTHVAGVLLHVASYPDGSLQKESRSCWNVDGRLVVRRHAADLARSMRPSVRLVHLRWRVGAHARVGGGLFRRPWRQL